MKKTFIEMKLFQVKPDRLEQFEAKIEEISANQLKCEGCISLKYFKRFYTIDGIKLGEPPRELTKIVKCVKYYSYWEFDTKENYGKAIEEQDVKTEYSESLVRRLVSKISVYEDKVTVKSANGSETAMLKTLQDCNLEA